MNRPVSMTLLPGLLALALLSQSLFATPLSARSACESCQDIVAEFCNMLEEVRASKRSAPTDCHAIVDQRCTSRCKTLATTSEPLEPEQPGAGADAP